ncbi:hypothetical protein AEAC466_04435 [Asticcacaulis sp. AC466]|uniref:hypothetical protein n=1 Tax=Asticcacaulis sp. AC466 TaxID=1282362 RepID=UPI0003C3F0AF|nr:hypothetical protein [Asticcacaulis sp. AC466]ESQ85418.1 hypothetical protein AEAC466_04435 [Asticcacaulis sp. AC466]
MTSRFMHVGTAVESIETGMAVEVDLSTGQVRRARQSMDAHKQELLDRVNTVLGADYVKSTGMDRQIDQLLARPLTIADFEASVRSYRRATAEQITATARQTLAEMHIELGIPEEHLQATDHLVLTPPADGPKGGDPVVMRPDGRIYPATDDDNPEHIFTLPPGKLVDGYWISDDPARLSPNAPQRQGLLDAIRTAD